MNNIKIYLKSILLPVLVGLIVGIITSGFIDYNALKKPLIYPPASLFPIIWTVLYVLMGLSYGILKANNLTNKNIDFIYYLQLAVNSLWSIFFFILKLRLFSVIWILLLAALVIIMIMKFYKQNKLSGFLQIPYLLWIIFATYLNYSIYILNR